MPKKGLEKFYELVESFESLPTIGKKTASRLAYHIVSYDTYCGIKLAHAIEDAIGSIKKCTVCGNISENEICEICLDDDRRSDSLCIVQSSKDIFTIEESRQFHGKYFVLSELEEFVIDSLVSYVQKHNTQEVLFALTPSIANDALILFVEDKLKQFDLKFYKIAQGVPTGVSLENVDMLSLSKALQSKMST